MTLPNFLIIGAPKCGTTSIYHYLRQHPDVFMSENKEPRFFSYQGGVPSFNGPGDERTAAVTEPGAYEALFSSATSERAIGEASTTYLYWPPAAPRIRRELPGVKLIAILRDPVERAYSNFLHQRQAGLEPIADFALALEAEPERISQNWAPFWHYAAISRYVPQLERYYGLFEREAIRVYLYDDFVKDPRLLLRDIFRFLEVDDGFVPDVSRRHRVTWRQRVRVVGRVTRDPSVRKALRPLLPHSVRRFLTEREARWNRFRPMMDTSLRQRLINENRTEIERLEVLLDRDLSSWLDANKEPRSNR